MVLSPLIKTGVAGTGDIYLALWANLVTCQLQLPSSPLLWWYPQQPSVSCHKHKTTQGRKVRGALNTHGGLPGTLSTVADSITTFQEFGAIFQKLLPRTEINLLFQLSKLASNVCCGTIQNRCIALTWPGWLRIITWDVKPVASINGLFLLSLVTMPWRASLTNMFLTMTSTLSSPRASLKASMVHFNRLYLLQL